MGTSSKIGRTERLEDFSNYIERKKDEIRLKTPKYKNQEKYARILVQRIFISIF